jgi:trans-aconitate methyltransferase
MTSDDRIINSGLKKIECLNCKLIRNGYPFSSDELKVHYETKYQLAQRATLSEPLFFTEKGSVPRSKVVFDWILQSLSEVGFSIPKSILELGCGEGSLLWHFAHYWKDCAVHGIDMNGDSVKKARARGLDVRKGGYRDISGYYDLIFSFAVIEHIPSPSDFISVLKSHLKPNGLLLVAQPCQDSGSTDIYFSDHLWHFFSDHITELGKREGLLEVLRSTSNEHVRNFSLHIFQRGTQHDKAKETVTSELSIDQTIAKWNKIFEGINKWLNKNEKRKLAVWGVGQTFTLFYVYTSLKDCSISMAFDDNPERYVQNGFPFPVIRFGFRPIEADHELAVLLTFKPISAVVQKLRESSISYYSPFEERF